MVTLCRNGWEAEVRGGIAGISTGGESSGTPENWRMDEKCAQRRKK